MSSQDFDKRMLDFVFEAGRIALQCVQLPQTSLKKDNTVITIADKKISDLLLEKLRDLLQTSEHLIIDEEHENVAELLDQKLLDKSKYIWSLDPIDGTRVYANGMPHFAVSLGLMKEGRPWMGAVNFPALRELFFCDGKESYFITEPFTPDEARVVIKPVNDPVTARSLVLCDDDFFGLYDWDYSDAQLLISAVAAVDLTWPTIGRGCGCVFRSSLWDLAGAWPILADAGLSLWHVETGALLEKLEVTLFDRKKCPWKLRDYYILSTEKNYHTIKSKIKAR